MKQDQQEPKKYDNAPKIETQISTSKDGRFVLHRTIITDIKPVSYYEKVLEGRNDHDDKEVGT